MLANKDESQPLLHEIAVGLLPGNSSASPCCWWSQPIARDYAGGKQGRRHLAKSIAGSL